MVCDAPEIVLILMRPSIYNGLVCFVVALKGCAEHMTDPVYMHFMFVPWGCHFMKCPYNYCFYLLLQVKKREF